MIGQTCNYLYLMMFKKAALFLSLLFIGTVTHAQTADQVYDQYLDFNKARLEGQTSKAMSIGESILANVGKLPAKSRTTYYSGLAKLYEDNSQPEKAITYNEMVAAAEPDYYVTHRALGYLYNERASAVYDKMRATKDAAVLAALTAEYKTKVLKALPHLEKAQACDPSDETLTLIKFLYNSIKDKQGLGTLNSRLTGLGKNCLSILSE